MYRVQRSKKIPKTEGGKDVSTWEAYGPAFIIPETWAVAVLSEDL
jgi:hypothetical protein